MNEVVKERHNLPTRRNLKNKKQNLVPADGYSNQLDKDVVRISETIQLLKKTLFELESLKQTENKGENLKQDVEFPTEEGDFYELIRLYKIKLIENALHQTRGRQNKAAKLLNIKATTLNSIIKKYKILT